MGFAFSGSITAYAYSTTSLSTVGGVDIALGDLVVVAVKNNGGNVISGLTDSAGNTYTAVDQRFGSNATIRLFYCLSATHAGTGVTHTATMATSTAQPTMTVAVFTPDAGDTVSLDIDVYATSGWASGTWSTSAANTTGDDAVAFAACQSNGDEAWSNHQIGNTTTGVNVITSPDLFGQTWYRILTATVTDCDADVTIGGGGQQAIEMLVFKSVSSGGGTTYNVSASDGISLSDASSGNLRIQAAVSDGIALGDSDSGSLAIQAAAADGLSLSDLASALFHFQVITADGIVLSDQATYGGQIIVSAADGITLSDMAGAALKHLASITDGIVLSDVVSGVLRYSVNVQDGISFSDALAAAVKMVLSVSDGVKLSDLVVDTTFLPSRKVSITISSRQASITFSSRAPGVGFST